VRLSDDEEAVRESFESLNHYIWNTTMAEMLGRDFRVLEVPSSRIVGLPSPDGSQQGVWYFPMDVVALAPLQAQGPGAWPTQITTVRLFSRGNTAMTCLPLVSAHLRILAWSYGDLIFWNGLVLLTAGLLTLCASLACDGTNFANNKD